ncbi:uncharacterized protein LOC110985446 [Acanthaster planci]|uniref:Uncharacterized protein LOC110985446 n=1 Tax=Acanthaster planci TaxID=133434 RepID=A0A8B7Z925_ACAPL|nr:uncharacterized protein LOC110985446 [Acanthaster planci]
MMASDSESSTSLPSAITFDVMLNDSASTKTRQAKCPERFQKGQTNTVVDTDMTEERARKMKEKQLKAQRRREEQEAARRLRINQRQEQCRLMASKMEKLLAQDAKRQGLAGTENIRPMTRREAGAMIQSVHRDFQQLGAELSKDMGT